MNRPMKLLPLTALLFAGAAMAQTFPTKVVRIINAQGPGVLEVVSRGYAQELQKTWGQPVIVENRAGAGSVLGADTVAKSAPDGHTILATSSAALTVNPWVMKNLPYDPDKDLSSLFGIGRTPSLISVPASLPVKNVQELVALAKQKPDGLAYGSAGVGSATHLQTEIFLREIGNVKALHVPYKGIADINRGLLGNEIQFGLTAVQLTIGAVKAGQVKAIGLIGERRDKLFPDVPTLREQGFPQSSGSIIWFGLALPAKTPPSLVARMAGDFARTSEDPEQKKVLDSTGWDLMLSGPEAFGELIRRERALIGKVVQEIGLKPE